jgi:hypothetical protein
MDPVRVAASGFHSRMSCRGPHSNGWAHRAEKGAQVSPTPHPATAHKAPCPAPAPAPPVKPPGHIHSETLGLRTGALHHGPPCQPAAGAGGVGWGDGNPNHGPLPALRGSLPARPATLACAKAPAACCIATADWWHTPRKTMDNPRCHQALPHNPTLPLFNMQTRSHSLTCTVVPLLDWKLSPARVWIVSYPIGFLVLYASLPG